MTDIKIYGKPTYTLGHIKKQVEDRLSKTGIDIKISEYTEVEDFIDQKIMSIPAVKVGDSIIQFRDHQQVRDMIEEVANLVLIDQQSELPLNITIPTDFSDASVNAIRYAFKFAKYVTSKLKLIHAYHPNPDSVISGITPAEDKEWRLELMEQLVNGLNSEWFGIENLECKAEGKIKEGFAADVILEEAGLKSNPFIFMSNSGETGALKQFFGSVSTKVVAESNLPVYIIPPHVEFKPLKKVVVAIDQLMSSEQLKTISTLVNIFNSEVILVHIDQSMDYNYIIIESQLKQLINKKENIKTEYLISKNKQQALLDYCESVKPDLLVINKSKRNKFIKFFTGSFSKHFSIRTKSPLLITPQ